MFYAVLVDANLFHTHQNGCDYFFKKSQFYYIFSFCHTIFHILLLIATIAFWCATKVVFVALGEVVG